MSSRTKADEFSGAWEFDWAVTFSQDMGFLKSGTDVQGLIHTGERTMRYLGCVSRPSTPLYDKQRLTERQIGQMPWLDRALGKNPWCPIKFATFENVAYYCYARVMERISSSKARSTEDFLDNFLSIKEQNPGVVDDNTVVSYLMMNVS
jgi:hypothetical protein